MAKETISQTEGLCKEVANCIRNAYDKGYKQGQKDMEQDTMAVLENGKMIGREEAWECARKIIEDVVEPHFESAYMVDIFGCESAITAMKNNSASEAIAKIKEYEEKQKQDGKSCKTCDHSYIAKDGFECCEIHGCDFMHSKWIPKQTGEIKVGDEVRNGGVIGIVTKVTDETDGHKSYDVIESNGKTWGLNDLVTKKTGRHFDQIAEVLKQVKGE